MQTFTPEQAGVDAQRLSRVDAVVKRYIDQGRIAGAVCMAARRGGLFLCRAYGAARLKPHQPMQVDSIFRIYSMTKIIASTALMMLMEEGLFRLTDPVHEYIPSFAKVQVAAGLDNIKDLRPPARAITIRDLLTHTAGMSYGFDDNAIDRHFRRTVWGALDKDPLAMTTERMIDLAAAVPLAFDPGSEFRYSFSIDVVGRLVEIFSGKRLDVFLKERIFDPLMMVDTHFELPADKEPRLAATYLSEPGKPLRFAKDNAKANLFPSGFHSAGGGLVSTASDYLTFLQMLLNGGGWNGMRLLGRKTIDLMTSEHLPAHLSVPGSDGNGHGLGVATIRSLAGTCYCGTVGSYRWGGAAGTKFWVDPAEQLAAVFMIQTFPGEATQAWIDFTNVIYGALE